VAEAPELESGPAALNSGGALSVHLTDRRHFGATLLFATGSSKHVEQLQGLAQRQGLALSPEGLKRGRKTIAARTEEDIFKTLGLPFIAPELREGLDEINRALAGELSHLVTDDDIRSILHAHTDLSDGVDTLDGMAEVTRTRGYQYFGVADHSKSAHYAGGLSIRGKH
jgi:DNA polymerase (family X)